jgi:hypothetical protein
MSIHKESNMPAKLAQIEGSDILIEVEALPNEVQPISCRFLSVG